MFWVFFVIQNSFVYKDKGGDVHVLETVHVFIKYAFVNYIFVICC